MAEKELLGPSGKGCIAGVDEAGRGPLAGPIVAAAVILRSFDFTSRIDDSKKLSSAQRENAYNEIIGKAFIGIGIIGEDTIDEINIHKANMIAMEEAVLNLGIVPGILLIDGNLRLRLRCRQLPIIDGDQKSASIACASIVAKVTRDRLLIFYDRLFPEYGFKSHKGYGTRQHYSALRRIGCSPLHRKSFI